MNQGRTKERPKNSQTEKVRFINIAVSFTLPYSTDRRPIDDREKSGITFARFFLHKSLHNTKKCCTFARQRSLDQLFRLLADGGVNGGASSNGGGVNLEELIFETIQKNLGINAPAIADILPKSLRTTQRYLKSLSDANRIAFRGAPKNGGYHVL